MGWLGAGMMAGLDVLLPRRCAHCKRHLNVSGPLCLACFRLLEMCRIPNWELPGFTPAGRPIRGISYYRRGSPLRAVHRIAKFGQSESCAHWLGQYAARRLVTMNLQKDLLIQGVPSHPASLRDRGLDIVGSLALALAHRVGGTRVKLVCRARLGIPQNHLDRDGSIANVGTAFRVGPDTATLEQSRIILIDDVVTTGATLDACAQVLEACGHTVSLVALAFRREMFALPGEGQSERRTSDQR